MVKTLTTCGGSCWEVQTGLICGAAVRSAPTSRPDIDVWSQLLGVTNALNVHPPPMPEGLMNRQQEDIQHQFLTAWDQRWHGSTGGHLPRGPLEKGDCVASTGGVVRSAVGGGAYGTFWWGVEYSDHNKRSCPGSKQLSHLTDNLIKPLGFFLGRFLRNIKTIFFFSCLPTWVLINFKHFCFSTTWRWGWDNVSAVTKC